MGLFSSKTFKITNPAALGKGCGKCQLYRKCDTPKMEPYGKGLEGLMILGEVPGATEDAEGIPFAGTASMYLNHVLRKLGINADTDCVKINAVSCHTKTPTGAHIDACRGRAWSHIDKYQPKVILALGLTALSCLIGHRWPKMKDSKETGLGSMARWFNWTIPDRQTKCWIVPCYHPSFILRERKFVPAADVWFEKAVKNAVRHLSVPMPKHKDEESCVEIPEDENTVCDRLHAIKKDMRLIAIDYETTGLKPYMEGHRVWYIGIADSENHAVVFPTREMKQAVKLFRDILQDPNIKKIAHNMPYEDLWSRERLGVQVKGWIFDTANSSHILNPTPGVAGLKFQTYVTTGLIDYSSHIASYLESTDTKELGANSFNTIQDAPPREIMMYCGIDCISTYRLAQAHSEKLKIYLEPPW
jgi:DNA polymerase